MKIVTPANSRLLTIITQNWIKRTLAKYVLTEAFILNYATSSFVSKKVFRVLYDAKTAVNQLDQVDSYGLERAQSSSQIDPVIHNPKQVGRRLTDRTLENLIKAFKHDGWFMDDREPELTAIIKTMKSSNQQETN